MDSRLTQPGWMDDLATARSVPLGGLKALSQAYRLFLVGDLSVELAEELELQPSDPAHITHLNRWYSDLNIWPPQGSVKDAEKSKKTDIVVLVDRWKAEALSYDQNYLRQLCLSVDAAVIFPARFQSRIVAIQWSQGFSWPEFDSNSSWIWCDALDPIRGEAILHNFDFGARSVRLNFSYVYPDGRPRPVTFSINGKVVAQGDAQKKVDVCVDIPEGETLLTWTIDSEPHVLVGGRSISFAICDLEVQDISGNRILSRDVVYGMPQDRAADIDDLLLRKRLHESGFVSVGGILRNGYGFLRRERMPTTIGSPSFSRPFDLDKDNWYCGTQCRANDIGWFVASPLSGRRFQEIVRLVGGDV